MKLDFYIDCFLLDCDEGEHDGMKIKRLLAFA